MSSLDADWREITRKNYAAGADVEHPKSGLAQEFVIENGSCQTGSCIDVGGFAGADNAALAEHAAILLAGDFFGHLEDHFDQRIVR